MRRRLLERMIDRENAIASYVFLLTASAVLAVYGSPVEIGVPGTLLAIAGTAAAYLLFLEAYCRLTALAPAIGARPAHLLTVALPVAVFGALLLAKGDAWFGSGNVWAKSFETAVGDYEMLVLSDNTVIELNTDTKIRTRYSRRLRQIVLERGEARFAAVHDAARPLQVLAEKVSATALGTEFSMRRRDESAVDVLVEQGRVSVAAWLGVLSESNRPAETILGPGEAAFIKGRAIVTQQLTAAELACKSSWRKKQLCFAHETLAEAAAEFNRYNRTKIVIGDESAGRLPVRGTFDATDPHTFVAAIGSAAALRSNMSTRTTLLVASGK
jgi:ferric-dicitrate binding protein FerR (iron transport regulator)